MTLITSKVQTRSPEYQANYAHMEEKLSALRAAVSHVKLGGGERSRQRHTDRGK